MTEGRQGTTPRGYDRSKLRSGVIAWLGPEDDLEYIGVVRYEGVEFFTCYHQHVLCRDALACAQMIREAILQYHVRRD